MWRTICRFLLFKLMGWKNCNTQEIPEKCLICVAPHTSNWDFFIGKLYYAALGRTSQFLMKKEWFFWPLGILFRSMGGIPVERSKKHSLTDQLAEIALKADKFSLAVTPEGTRSRVEKWKRGFYYIALKAKLPILLFAIDFPTKRIVCTETLIPSGDVERDMKRVMDYYSQFTGKNPELFQVEKIEIQENNEDSQNVKTGN